jgi:membrane-bound serine protease (ClpP class)
MFLLLAVLLLLLLPTPWNAVAALAALAVGGIEVLYFYRRMRGEKVVTGVENLIGAAGKVTEPLTPIGQIRVQGELWEARSSVDTQIGLPVRVLAVDGLTLHVEPDSPAEDA